MGQRICAIVLLTLILVGCGGTPASPTPLPTVAIKIVEIPTVTPAPTNTLPPPATDTVEAPTQPPAANTDTPAPATTVLEVFQPANVRSGPGTNYPPVGGLQVGQQPTVTGRDSSGTWYVIDYQGRQGWVSNLVARFNGDLNSLPVVQAPPTPVPTATSAPTKTSIPVIVPTSTTAPSAGRGIRGDYFRVENPVASVNADIWFNFKVTNTTNQPISYGSLGAKVINGQAQSSWSEATLQPGQVLEWRDHINIGTAGDYNIALGICFLGGRGACESSPTAGWEILSATVLVQVR